jgi:HPt (histidine-containing phosphotransfer) domain-containing protein
MTAHAMSGDRERCLAAGMDTYVSKPLRPNELVDVVERFALPRSSPRPGTADAPTPRDVVFDVERARRRLGGDRQLLREMIAIFRAEAPGMVNAINAAAADDDYEALGRAAHSLRGSLGTLDAPRAFQAAAHLEAVARGAKVEQVLSAIAELKREMTALDKALAVGRRRAAAKVTRHASQTRRRHTRRR